jgi:hypothetical protein
MIAENSCALPLDATKVTRIAAMSFTLTILLRQPEYYRVPGSMGDSLNLNLILAF